MGALDLLDKLNGVKRDIARVRKQRDAALADLAAIRKDLLSVSSVPPGDHGEVEGVRLLIERAAKLDSCIEQGIR